MCQGLMSQEKNVFFGVKVKWGNVVLFRSLESTPLMETVNITDRLKH